MILESNLVGHEGDFNQCTYHRLVKTTPKPNATKNSKGELVGPPPPPPPVLEAVGAAALAVGGTALLIELVELISAKLEPADKTSLPVTQELYELWLRGCCFVIQP